MSGLLAENLNKILSKHLPQYAICLRSIKEIYKRTTIIAHEEMMEHSLSKRTDIVDAFKKFTLKILPEMEKAVEMNLLKNRFEQIKDERAKESILQAFHKRALTRYAYMTNISDYQYYPPDVIGSILKDPRDIFT